MGDEITIHPDGDTLHLVSRTAEADLKVLTGKIVPEIVEDGEMIATLTGPVLKSLLRAGTFSSKDPKHSRPALEVVVLDFDGRSATAYAGDGNGLAVVTEILPQTASGLLRFVPSPARAGGLSSPLFVPCRFRKSAQTSPLFFRHHARVAPVLRRVRIFYAVFLQSSLKKGT